MTYAPNLPEGFAGTSDAKLPVIVRHLARLLANTQREFATPTLKLGTDKLEDLAGILVDFAVDIHNDIGIFAAYERYNTAFFGSPLPLTHDTPTTGISRERVAHLLWMIYPLLAPGLTLAPQHRDLLVVAAAAADFLNAKVGALAKDSGIKQFMDTSNELGWDVKRKLVWIGTRSYMFRLLYKEYMVANANGKFDIGTTDDFICQETTRWSGLGCNDIQAAVLDIPEEQRQELRSWYLRHASAYKIVESGDGYVDALNVVNDVPYHIRFSVNRNPFKPGMLVYGSVVPWRGEWYWSGSQQPLGEATQPRIDTFKESMRKQTNLACRYWKEQARLVQDRFAVSVKRMLAFHGTDLIVYPDGLTMAADGEREMKAAWAAHSPEDIAAAMKAHDLKNPCPKMEIPKYILEHDLGVAVFINPDEGKEILLGYHEVVSGLKKNGEGLTTVEVEALMGAMESAAISPAFVQRLLREHGGEASVMRAFMLARCDQCYGLEYLLRSRKGHFYRQRFPAISVC